MLAVVHDEEGQVGIVPDCSVDSDMDLPQPPSPAYIRGNNKAGVAEFQNGGEPGL